MHRKLSTQAREEIIARALKGEPIGKLTDELRISKVLLYRWLKRYKSKGKEGLEEGRRGRPGKNKNKSNWKMVPRFSANDRLLVVHQVVNEGRKLTEVANANHISRVTLYKWIKEYKSGQGLERKKRDPTTYYGYTPELYEQAVLALVLKHPEYGIRQIVNNLPKIGRTSILGHHGVQRVLERHELSAQPLRLAYAQSRQTQAVRAIERTLGFWGKLFELPEQVRIRLVRVGWATGLAAFVTLAGLGVVNLIRTSLIQTGGNVGIVFAYVALLSGTFFFVYSFKYYFTIAIVLSFSQGLGNLKLGVGRQSRGGLWGWLIGSGKKGGKEEIWGYDPNDPVGLQSDLNQVHLKRYPFVSVQVPFYNEKKVIERSITAAIAMDYPEYEVVLADDSTDETTQIARTMMARYGDAKTMKGEGWEMTSVEVRKGLIMKHLHRTTRQGYKGGALNLVMKLVDPRTEFTCIFDADFVPYPDSLIHFLKYFKMKNGMSEEYGGSKIAAVQGYQWHVLNKSENWITRGVRTEYAGSYVIERAGEELYGGLKQISGAVYMIRQEPLREVGWGVSITEDFELTLKLYAQGYKVVYTPYIQAPAECVSTLKRLIRQRMRWAEGHSHNVRKMASQLLFNAQLTIPEKLEFLYLMPYYLQAAFFLIGTSSWFISEAVLKVRIPFWTEVWGWSLVLTNMFSLPLMNGVGMFLEESDERDYVGLASFVALSYVMVPFQAYAAIKGFLNKEEGPWFRTPKTGMITDVFRRNMFYRFIRGILPGKQAIMPRVDLSFLSLPRKSYRRIGRMVVAGVVLVAVTVGMGSRYVPLAQGYVEPDLKLKSIGQTRVDKEEVVRKATAKEITSTRVIARTTKGGKPVEFIFEKEPKVTIKLEDKEITFATQFLAGQKVAPKSTKMYEGKEVVYEEIIPGIDLRYQVTNDLIVEEFVVKNGEAARKLGAEISQKVSVKGVKVVSPDPQAFGFYDDDGREIITLTQPFLEDAVGQKNLDIKFEMEKEFGSFVLKKTLGEKALEWMKASERVYPIIVDPSAIVSGGIAEAETQFGGLQRKVAFVNSNWYAFYNTSANDCATTCSVNYKRSSDGVSWGSAVDMDVLDTDNYNPSISVSGNFIIVFWVDDGSEFIEGKSIDTATSDLLSTVCQSGSQTSIDSTNMVTVAAVSTTEAVVAYSDTSTDTEFDVWDVTNIITTCVPTFTDLTPGNITFGSGLSAEDRPVVVPYSSTRIGMVFQDGNLSYSEMNPSLDEWSKNNLTIASVTDNVYSVVTDGTSMWVLSVSGTTATNFYKCCSDDWAETQIDADTGGADQDGLSDLEMFCVSATDCKLVFTDIIDSAGSQDLVFVDCDNADCSTNTVTILDADINAGTGTTQVANPAIYCVDTDDCKIVYQDTLGAGSPDIVFIDCDDAESGCVTGVSAVITDSDFGGAASDSHLAIWCPAADNCKFLYDDDDAADVIFVDCADDNCANTTDTLTQIGDFGAATTMPRVDLYCVLSTQCKAVFHDDDASDFVLVDCSTAGTPETCATPPAMDIIDNDVGATDEGVPVAIDCVGGNTDCKLLYGDGTDGDLTFIDCNAADCTTVDSTQDIDSLGGGYSDVDVSVDMDCVAADDCKIIYVGNTTSTTEQLYFVDCDNAGCSTGSVIATPGPRYSGAVYCTATADCKLLYYEGSSDADVVFADCDVTNCFPAASTLTAPWTSETAIETVSLTYDSSNSDLYAHVIMDTSDKAYWKSTDATTISWSGQTDYGWTTGTLNQISAPETAAGTSQIGVVLHEATNSNYEFAAVPENLMWLLVAVPAGVGYLRRRRRG